MTTPAPTIESLILARSKRLIYRLIASAAILFVVLWSFLYVGFQAENARRIAQGLEGQVEYLTKTGDQFTITRLLSSLVGGGPFQTAAVLDGDGRLVVVVPEGASVIAPKERGYEFTGGRLTLWHCIVRPDSRLPEWGTLCVATRSSPWAALWAAAVLVVCLLGLSLAWLNGFKRLSREIAGPVVDFAASILNADLTVKRGADASKDFGLDEVNKLSGVFERFWAKSVEYDAKAREMEVQSAMNRFATQVAHDIRSPLAALEVVAGDVAQLPEDKRDLIQSAAGRIRDIANSLLDKHRALSDDAPSAAPPAVSALLGDLVGSLVGEKRMEYRSRGGVEIEARLDPLPAQARARIQPVEFKRLLSNLINNSVEALGGGGAVSVGVDLKDGWALVSVRDNGKGIAPEILAKLGERGATHGKEGGSGLGVHHARASAESWGGRLEVESAPGKGTTVTVFIPLESSGALVRWDAILIDDDELTRAAWRIAASRSGKALRSFPTADAFFAEAGIIDRGTRIYIDAELSEGVRGDIEALKIHELGFGEIYLATGYDAKKFADLKHLRGVTGKEPPWGSQ